MPKDTYDSRRKPTGLPLPGIYTGQRSKLVNAHTRESVDAHTRESVDAHTRESVDAHTRESVDAHTRESVDAHASTGDGVVYEPSFNATLANAAFIKHAQRETEAGATQKAPDGAAKKTSGGKAQMSAENATQKASAGTAHKASRGAQRPSGTNRGSGGSARTDAIAGRLAEILEHETLLYEDAAAISAKKTEIIVHGKIEELDSLVKAEQAIIIKIGKLEDEREEMVKALSDELDLNLENVTLSDISTRLSDESYERLSNCQESLAGTLIGLKESNDMNAQLIQNALDYVNFSVNLLTTDQNSGNIYSQDGEEAAARQRRNIFDVKL